MHDIILAKEIIDEVLRITKEKKLNGIKGVKLEIGSVALSHDGLGEHTDDVSPENLKFILENLSGKSGLNKAKFDIKKIPGSIWRIRNIKVE
jgi:Zn finger protein HypA/HybF involved in hydrogenase expression